MLFFHMLLLTRLLLLCCFEHDSINWIVAKFKGLAGQPLADVIESHILSDLSLLLTVE